MICLDTNYLIMGLVADSDETARLLAWADRGETFCVSSVVWYEFLCGPITPPQAEAMRALMSEIVPFGSDLAEEAARLFNRVGRARHLRVDAMIAALPLTRGIPFATRNTADFAPFSQLGLQMLG
jgi:predicted nucleic acid-binding protein